MRPAVNGDGFADLLVGARGHNTSRGKAYLYLGSTAGPGASPAWTAAGQNAGDEFSASLATAGDVNSDGYADVIAGAEGYPQGAGYGKAYIYHGSPGGLGASPAWTAAGENAADQFGHTAGAAGDVNSEWLCRHCHRRLGLG